MRVTKHPLTPHLAYGAGTGATFWLLAKIL